MREMRDLFVGDPAFGNVVDDIDDVAGRARGVADDEPLGSDVALAFCLAFPDVLVHEQAAVGRLQRLLLVGQDLVGAGLRKQLDSRSADNEVARNAELSLGHAVDQQIAAIMHTLHRDLRRNMIDDLAQEGLVAVAFLFELAAFGDVFHRGDPAAMGQRPADRQEGTPVGALHAALIDPAACDVSHDSGTEFVDVSGEGPGVLAMLHQVAQLRARLHDLGRQPVHVDVAPVESDDASRRIVHHQTLDHVVQRSVELAPLRLQPLLRFTALPGDLPDDQEQNECDHHRRQRGGGDQESGLLAPVCQCGGDRIGRDHDTREVLQRRCGAEPVRAVDRAQQAERLRTALIQDKLQQRRICEFLSDHRFDARIAGQHRSIGMHHSDGGIGPEGDGREEFLIIGGIDAPRHHTEKASVRPGQPMGNDGIEIAADQARNRLGHDRRRLWVGFERQKVRAG